jgi:UDP-N-acetyl-2-amino-2-deoxyglucuronate dehydrogenase
MALRIAIVGSGEMGRKYADALTHHVRDAELVGVAAGSRAPALAREFGVPTLEVDDVWTRSDIDAVIIATPHSTHVPLATAAARAGKHVYIEKPLARDVQECDQIIDACERAGVVLTVNTVTRFRPSAMAARKALDEGRIGRLRMLRVLSSAVAYDPDYKSWTSDPAEGGIWLDWGCHGCDAIRWFVGGSPTSVFGRVTDYSPGPALGRSAMVEFAYASGVSVQLLMSFEMPAPGLGSASQWTFIGDRGIIELDGYAKCRLGTADGWEELSDQKAFDFVNEPLAPHLIAGFAAQVEDFVDAIRAGRPPVVTGADGRASVEMVQGARQSQATGGSVALPL